MPIKTAIFGCFFLAFSYYGIGQEKRCIPSVWKAETVKGYAILTNGDSLAGKFEHLTPVNDIKTSHVIYTLGKTKEYIPRKDIKYYYDKKKKETRYKVYTNTDSTFIKKNCFFDQGKFLLVIEYGQYILVKDKLNYNSSISAYSQSRSDDIYYILLPSQLLVEVNMAEIKFQMESIFMTDPKIGEYEFPEDFGINDMIALIDEINSNY